MHINELPEIVLTRLYFWVCNSECISPNHYNLNRWKSKLTLLSVCGTWRRLALPTVHRTSFVRCIYGKRYNNENHYTSIGYSDADDHDELSSSDEADNVQMYTYSIKSSLDLVSNNNYPRVIQIYIKTPNDPIHCYQRILEMIRKHSSSLKLVKNMEVFSIPVLPSMVWPAESTSIAEAKLIGEECYSLLPSVQYVEWLASNNVPVMVEFFKSLMKGYAHQLIKIDCPQLALEDVHSFSDKLKYINVKVYDDYVTYMPKICAENLVTLTLRFRIRDFDWSSFESTGGSNLHFSNLQWLRLYVETNIGVIDGIDTDIYPTPKLNYKIIAPNLKNVMLSPCPCAHSFLSSICGLTAIENVTLEMDKVKLFFTRLNLDVGRGLFASYANNGQGIHQPVDIYAYMNAVFNIHNLSECSSATVEFHSTPLDVEQINWKYLNGIGLDGPIYVSDLQGLISRLPNVEKLYIEDLQLKRDDEIAIEIFDEEAVVTPLESSISSIEFGWDPGYTESEVDKLQTYLGKLLTGD